MLIKYTSSLNTSEVCYLFLVRDGLYRNPCVCVCVFSVSDQLYSPGLLLDFLCLLRWWNHLHKRQNVHQTDPFSIFENSEDEIRSSSLLPLSSQSSSRDNIGRSHQKSDIVPLLGLVLSLSMQ
jgi:hypothetical protein